MKDADVAIRYARALFEAAHKKGQAGPTREALKKVSGWFKEHPEYSRMFLNPTLHPIAKEKAIQKVLPSGAPLVLERFLGLLMRNKRLGLLSLIAERFERIVDASEGLARASVRSARALSDIQRRSVTEALARALGRRVKGEFREDPALLGGVVVKVGDKVVDLSISGQLSRLKESLREAP